MENKFVPVEIKRNKKFLEYLFAKIIGQLGFICGGYARYCCAFPGDKGKRKIIPASDLDIYCYNDEAYNIIRQKLLENGFSQTYENNISIGTKSGFTGYPPINLIKPFIAEYVKTSGPIEEVLSNFDFTVARCGIYLVIDLVEADDFKIIRAIADEEFIEDEKHNRLRIKHIHCPVAEFFRLMKYANKGFNASALEIVKTLDDWEQRSDDYKIKVRTFLKKENPSQKDIDELEKLLRID